MAIDKTFSVTRHTLTTEKPFDEFIGELEKRSPVVPPSKFEDLADLNVPQDQPRARVESLIGRRCPSYETIHRGPGEDDVPLTCRLFSVPPAHPHSTCTPPQPRWPPAVIIINVVRW